MKTPGNKIAFGESAWPLVCEGRGCGVLDYRRVKQRGQIPGQGCRSIVTAGTADLGSGKVWLPACLASTVALYLFQLLCQFVRDHLPYIERGGGRRGRCIVDVDDRIGQLDQEVVEERAISRHGLCADTRSSWYQVFHANFWHQSR